MMDGEIAYILNDCERLILLLRACRKAADREDHLDCLNRNIEELRRLHLFSPK